MIQYSIGTRLGEKFRLVEEELVVVKTRMSKMSSACEAPSEGGKNTN